MMVEKNKIKENNPEITEDYGRRKFLKSLALVGGCALVAGTTGTVLGRELKTHILGRKKLGPFEYTRDNPENIIYSACHMCSRNCAAKCKISDGVLVKIDGSAFNPGNKRPNIGFGESLGISARIDGVLCSYGQGGVGAVYNPNRVKQVLKRAPGTPRGGGQWQVVDFGQAVNEIVNGGDLFGEGLVKGLRDLYAFKNRDAARTLADDAAKVKRSEISIEQFRTAHSDILDALIDPDRPWLGPVNNRLAFLGGNSDTGRRELINWFLGKSFGSLNNFDKFTGTCDRSILAWENAGLQHKNGAWTGSGSKPVPDYSRAQYAIFFGEGFSDPDFAPPAVSGQIANSIISGDLKAVLVGSRVPRAASRLTNWITIQPGSEATFVRALLAWIIQNGRFDRSFLENANRASAEEDGNSAFIAASYLVKMENGRPSGYLHADEIGIGSNREFVVMRDGNPLAVDPDDSSVIIRGDLDTTFSGSNLTARTAFGLIKDFALEKSIDQYANECGVTADAIVSVADDFASHGAHSMIHTTGLDISYGGKNIDQMIVALNMLVGNFRPDGAMSFAPVGAASGSDNSLFTEHPNNFPVFGTRFDRAASWFDGNPENRLADPFSRNPYDMTTPLISGNAPYRPEILFLHNLSSELPSHNTNLDTETLRNTSEIKMIVACESVMSESALFADYIFPDTKSMESWGIEEIAGSPNRADTIVCQPVVKPMVETVDINGVQMPVNLESVLIAIAKGLGLPGFGDNALGDGKGLNHPDDWYLNSISKLAGLEIDGNTVPDADSDELEVFIRARGHLPEAVFDLDRIVQTVDGRYLNRIIYILNRGGRFASATDTSEQYQGFFNLC